MSSRKEFTIKNFIWSFLSVFLSKFIAFIIRTIFIKVLGELYLGVDGLFSNVLGLLSFADLGIGSAISFALYKPLAKKDNELTAQIVSFYKKACAIIALVVALVGSSLVPFLNIITKESDGIENLRLIYLLFLLDSVLSYLISYKTIILTADQKNYKLVRINTVFLFVTSLIQIVVLLLFKNYIFFLAVRIVVCLIERVYLYFYIDKCYPFIKNKKAGKLSDKERAIIKEKVKGLIYHKIGGVAIFQTDSIITSSIINVSTVGLVSNFILIIKTVNDFFLTVVNSATSSLGNIIAIEDNTEKYNAFRKYDFIITWLYGFGTVCLYFLLTPFVEIWLGSDKLIDNDVIILLCINFYMLGLRSSVGNMKSASGIFYQGRWAPIAESIINLCVSIICAFKLGLKGVYIGTVTSGFIPSFVAPYYLYKYSFGMKAHSYYFEYVIKSLPTIFCIALLKILFGFVPEMNYYFTFLIKLLICLIFPNLVYFTVWRKDEKFNYFKSIILDLIHKLH